MQVCKCSYIWVDQVLLNLINHIFLHSKSVNILSKLWKTSRTGDFLDFFRLAKPESRRGEVSKSDPIKR